MMEEEPDRDAPVVMFRRSGQNEIPWRPAPLIL